ncbi:MAG: hypothetical protein SF052_08725 [Bacteroidia bacterium]|nr:hypothetical protein [Bacteroidia bacterium]
MKKRIFQTLICLFWLTSVFLTANAQSPLAQAVPAFKLEMQQSGGTNGSSVTYDPLKGIYYAVIAGNAAFPLEAFDRKGKPLGASEAGADLRGIWMNGSTLEGNCPGEVGWVSIELTNSGKPSGQTSSIVEDELQPDFQSVGTFDPKKKEVIFYANGNLNFYSRKKRSLSRIVMLNGSDASFPDNINATSVGFTGKKGYEYALLDYNDYKVLYFNKKGNQTGSTDIPEDAIINDAFRFSFANSMLWLYDVDTRSWSGYKVF